MDHEGRYSAALTHRSAIVSIFDISSLREA
jgi:hypothetical protein